MSVLFIALKAKGSVPSRSDVKQKKPWNVLCTVANVLFLGLLGDLANSRAVCTNIMYCPLVFRVDWQGCNMVWSGEPVFSLSISETCLCHCAFVLWFLFCFFFLKHYQMLLQLQTYCVAEQCVFSACRCSRQNFIHDLFTGCCRVSGFRMVSWIPKKETRLGNYFLSWYTSQEHRPAPQSHPSDFKPMSLRSWKQPIVSR